MQASTAATDPPPPTKAGHHVLKHTLIVGAAQVLGMPLSILTNAMMARYIGPGEFGHIYLATTIATFGFLAVDWGRTVALTGAVARDRSEAGRLLGSSLAWCLSITPLVYAVLALGAWSFGYGPELQWPLALVFLVHTLTSLVGACQDTIRGHERADIGAYGVVGQQLLVALFVIPVIVLGGRTRGALLAQACAGLCVLLVVARGVRFVGVRRLGFSRSSLRSLLVAGTPIVFVSLAQVLQPNVDVLYLSKLAPADAMGWYAVSRRLIGVLLFPILALTGTLYPTLCRLQMGDPAGFARTTGQSLRAVALMVVPVACGCALFPELGISIFNRSSFGPAEDNLRVLAIYLFLVYFSMPLGCCIMALGRERLWSAVQALCVGVSLLLDPLLVPLFQSRSGNGGLGLCWAAVVSEVIVVAIGFFIAPRGILSWKLVRSMLLALLAGLAMAGVAFGLRSITPWVAAPIAVSAYGLTLLVTGGVEKEQLAKITAFVQRKLNRGVRTGSSL